MSQLTIKIVSDIQDNMVDSTTIEKGQPNAQCSNIARSIESQDMQPYSH